MNTENSRINNSEVSNKKGKKIILQKSSEGMSWQNVDEFNTRQETVKCVVVGDTAVGKTRLICARACNAYLSLPQMLATHIPTVWAIDQYRIHKEVLKRSWMIVDGVNVSLRLWDTFGDHEKDRKFAYGRSDVVLLCFSISSPQSFKHCKTKWFPEIRQYCPNVPIVLVGCKNDLRHVYRDERFLELCKERSPFIRIIQESDLITREQGRQLANEIGASYYESSVLTQYGVDAVFENAVRLALIARRQQRFWVKSLRNVTSPLLQIPYRPPKPREPETKVLPSTFEEDMYSLLDKEYETDVNLMVGKSRIHSHKIILTAASSHFKQIFISSSLENSRGVTLPTFVKLTPSSVQCFLRFLYTGDLSIITNDIVDDLKIAATFTDIAELKIPFPGVTKEAFDIFLHYLYTDSVDESLSVENCLPVIELANRLCLPRLISVAELHIVQKLSTMKAKGISLNEQVFKLLEPCQVHNADQLAEWCQYYIIILYQDISLNAPKLIRSLHPDNQAYLNKNRWPPAHFLKEQEFYDRCLREQESYEKPQRFLMWKAAKKKVSGCLCPKPKMNVPDNCDSDSKHVIICTPSI
ncbi:rho-related BTB domain-containing protein 1 [Trichonephila inaurata madagascariensis]|uniref:Rho-related BTB domain-containing protein 1 n=1 Tax=Trichonephila inaurata madagascariensis TaxID=2747483 RepID=A0A8X6Y6W0_9ARAC|nr:rho-related BTB domain-containing protein 1 [Trichonephila inaurata madagascariensis]